MLCKPSLTNVSAGHIFYVVGWQLHERRLHAYKYTCEELNHTGPSSSLGLSGTMQICLCVCNASSQSKHPLQLIPINAPDLSRGPPTHLVMSGMSNSSSPDDAGLQVPSVLPSAGKDKKGWELPSNRIWRATVACFLLIMKYLVQA